MDHLLNEQRCPLSAPEKQKLLREVMDEIFGLGPLEELLRDPQVTDILINGPHQIYLERQGRLMVRMVASELSGRRLEPAPDEIIRTVGNPPPMKGQ